ncbi:MAG: NAD(P)H-quinone oxidoreductase [Rhodospirillales bacterium]|nr:NAD(P)H-quinone oxidoreductase [Rhodospirillales bacterium]
MPDIALPTMRAIEISEPGGPEVLKPTLRERPNPGPGEVLIRVAAAGINSPDLKQCAGAYPAPKGASDLPGLEVSGTIEAIGADVTEWASGDAVCALVNGGGYAEYCAVPAAQCLPVPTPLNMVEAAALPETFFTVWNNVFMRAGLTRGESFLIHGGSGGVGTAAIQIAKALGAHVFATASTDEKCAVCKNLGAHRAINYRAEDFVEIVKEETPNRGVDVILDMIGGEYVQRNIKALAVEGRLVQIAFDTGPKVELNLMPILLKRLTLTGSTLRPRTPEFKAEIARQLRRRVWPEIEAGNIKPVIHATFPLDDAADAHRMMEEGGHIGNIVLEI